MGDKEAPFKDSSDNSSFKKDLEDNELEKVKAEVQERKRIFEEMSKYEQKLIKGLMRGFGNTMILWLISKERQHGYEIMTRLHESAPINEDKMPSASKIYPVLHDLEKHGLIKGSWEHQGKRKVKYYEITEEGEKTLSRFRELAKLARENHSSLWVDFVKDMISTENKE
ncbi:PadR family transcriptional regulator [Methanobacterium sp. ACI-7]|uniref:PadR family transcriptional regulator n=1 Tax=unclassified Methanobacterium TaxID=2627676 RepID=UPI0039C3F26C